MLAQRLLRLGGLPNVTHLVRTRVNEGVHHLPRRILLVFPGSLHCKAEVQVVLGCSMVDFVKEAHVPFVVVQNFAIMLRLLRLANVARSNVAPSRHPSELICGLLYPTMSAGN